MHQRNVIRNAITAALTGATVAGANVFSTQKLLYVQDDLPAIAVYAQNETSTWDQTAPRELDRKSIFVVESIVDAGENVDDAMDDIAEEIEVVMDTDPFFKVATVASAYQSHLTASEMMSLEDGDREIGILTLTYQVSYRTDAFVAPTDPDDFNTADATYNLGGEQDEADQTSDEITVQS